VLADHDGVEARGHAEKMPDRVRAAPGEYVPRALGTAPDEVGAQEVFSGAGVFGAGVDLQSVAGGEHGHAFEALAAQRGQEFRQRLGGDGEAFPDRHSRFPVAQADQDESDQAVSGRPAWTSSRVSAGIGSV